MVECQFCLVNSSFWDEDLSFLLTPAHRQAPGFTNRACKKGTPASPAMARARSVLPVPGEPLIITPDREIRETRKLSLWVPDFQVGGAITILKNHGVRQWEGLYPIYEMEKKHVGNHQPGYCSVFPCIPGRLI